MPTRSPRHNPIFKPTVVQRLSPTKRGYDRAWQRLRRFVLAGEPLCRFCAAKGLLVAATDVDHIQTIEDRPDLRLDQTNCRPLCHSCHSTLTASQQRGYLSCV
jgi:5-methylcytosine-specific restriction protein A